MTKEEKLLILNTLVTSGKEAKDEAEKTVAEVSQEIAFQQRLIEHANATVDFAANQLSSLQADIAAVNAGKL